VSGTSYIRLETSDTLVLACVLFCGQLVKVTLNIYIFVGRRFETSLNQLIAKICVYTKKVDVLNFLSDI